MYAIAGAILIHAAVSLSGRGPAPVLYAAGIILIFGDVWSKLPGYVFFKPRAYESPASDDASVSKDAAAGTRN